MVYHLTIRLAECLQGSTLKHFKNALQAGFNRLWQIVIIHLSILMGNGYVIAAKMAVNQ